MGKEGEGYRDFPTKFFCVTVPKISVGESFTVALISGMAKVRMREGEYQEFPSKTFCLTVPNNFRNGDPFSVSLISGIETFYAPEGYVTNFDFLSKFFLSHSAGHFRM